MSVRSQYENAMSMGDATSKRTNETIYSTNSSEIKSLNKRIQRNGRNLETNGQKQLPNLNGNSTNTKQEGRNHSLANNTQRDYSNARSIRNDARNFTE